MNAKEHPALNAKERYTADVIDLVRAETLLVESRRTIDAALQRATRFMQKTAGRQRIIQDMDEAIETIEELQRSLGGIRYHLMQQGTSEG